METRHIIDLQRFADGGAGAGSAGAGASGGEGAGAPAAGETGVNAADAARHGRRANPLANVRYGTQRAQAPAQDAAVQQEEAAQEQQESFEDLIKGRYKADFDQRVQQIIQARFRNQADSQAQLDRLMPTLEALGARYGIRRGEDGTFDTEALMAKVSDDDSLYEEEAMERGVTTDVLREIKHLEAENERHRREEAQRAQENQLQQHFRGLAEQAEQLKSVYQGFDLRTEMQNPEFARLVSPGINLPVKTAYEVIHKDELINGAMQYGVQRTAAAVAHTVQANQRRPDENGIRPGAAVQTKTDPRQLKKADFAEIRRRVARGEKITFDR